MLVSLLVLKKTCKTVRRVKPITSKVEGEGPAYHPFSQAEMTTLRIDKINLNNNLYYVALVDKKKTS